MTQNDRTLRFRRDSSFLYARARQYLERGNAVDALFLLRQLRAMEPDNADYAIDTARLLFDAGSRRSSERIALDLLAGEQKRGESLFVLAMNRIAQNDLQGAKILLEQVLKESPEDAEAKSVQNILCGIELTTVILKKNRLDRAKESVLLQRARTMIEAGRGACAQELLDKAMALECQSGEMLAYAAIAAQMCGDAEKAETLAEKAAEEGSDDGHAECLAAQVLAGVGKGDRAWTLLKQVREDAGEDDEVDTTLLAYSMAAIRLYAEAAAQAKRNLEVNPFDRNMLHLRAVSLLRSGAETRASEALWERMLMMDPGDGIARVAHQDAVNGRLEMNPPEIQPMPSWTTRCDALRVIAKTRKAMRENEAVPLNDAQVWDLIAAVRNLSGEGSVDGWETLAALNHPIADSELRVALYRNELSEDALAAVEAALKKRGAEEKQLRPIALPGKTLEQQLIPLTVPDRQIVRHTVEILNKAGIEANQQDILKLWQRYRAERKTDYDVITHTREGAAALALCALGPDPSGSATDRLLKAFGADRRRTNYYCKRMKSVLRERT